MREIIGNTTATPNPRPDWLQTDPTKADYIKNKPEILTTSDVEDIVARTSGESGTVVAQVQSDWAQTDITKADYIKNKPIFKFDTLLSASIEDNIFNLNQGNDACVVSVENNVLTLL